MKDLRTLEPHQCEDPHIFVRALHPSMSPLGVVVCPQLEELVIVHGGIFDIKDVVGTVAARASGGAKLKTVGTVYFPDMMILCDSNVSTLASGSRES